MFDVTREGNVVHIDSVDSPFRATFTLTDDVPSNLLPFVEVRKFNSVTLGGEPEFSPSKYDPLYWESVSLPKATVHENILDNLPNDNIGHFLANDLNAAY